MKWCAKCVATIFLLCSINILFASPYSLPQDYDPKTSDLQFSERSDGTYDVYLEIPSKHIPKAWIYHSRMMTFFGVGSEYINSILVGNIFSYEIPSKISTEMIYDVVYLNLRDLAVSPVYPDNQNTLYPQNYSLLISPNNLYSAQYLILQPIFVSQPKVWILIKRDSMARLFPGLVNDESYFTNDGSLSLVRTEKRSEQDARFFEAVKREIIPINYSIFEKSVTKPTCYSLPEDHKLRPCTTTEAKLRTPALKVFLGENLGAS